MVVMRKPSAIYCGGGGFVLLKREVIERMIAAYPETRDKSAHALPKAVKIMRFSTE
jgi:hypothetical protein